MLELESHIAIAWYLLLFLSGVESLQWLSFNANNFESDSRNISFCLTFSTESRNQNLVILRNEIEATISWDEGSDFLSVLLEENSASLSNGGVGLFGLDTQLLNDESLGMWSRLEWVFVDGADCSLVVFLRSPSDRLEEKEVPLESSFGCQFSSGLNSSWFARAHADILYFV